MNGSTGFTVHIGSDFDGNIGVGGTIYVTGPDAVPFPDDSWYDLPIDVMRMWCWNMLTNLNKSQASFDLLFMDGPYQIKVSKKNNDVNISFEFDDGSGFKSTEKFDIKFFDLANEIYRSANRLIYMVEGAYSTKISETGHVKSSVEFLKRNVKELGEKQRQMRQS
jgi:hypothetical protein